MTKDPIRQIAQRLGVPKGNTRDDAVRNICRALSHADAARERAASASPEAQTLLADLAFTPSSAQPPRHAWRNRYRPVPPQDRLPAEELYDLGLLGPGADGRYRPTSRLARWQALEAAQRWALLADAWWRSGQDDAGDAPLVRLAEPVPHSLAPAELGAQHPARRPARMRRSRDLPAGLEPDHRGEPDHASLSAATTCTAPAVGRTGCTASPAGGTEDRH